MTSTPAPDVGPGGSRLRPLRGAATAALRAVGRALGSAPAPLPAEGLRELVRGLAAGAPDGLGGTLARALRSALRDAPAAEVHASHEALLRLVAEDPRSVEYAVNTGLGLAAQLAAVGAPVTVARVLELGPGWSWTVGLTLVAAGAASWTGADVAPLATTDAAFYRALRGRVARGDLRVGGPGAPFDVAAQLARLDAALDLSGPAAALRAPVARYLAPCDAAALPLPDGAFDLVVSMAVLEHVRDPVAALRETARLLAPGGTALHAVDLRDHRDFDRPRAFLRDDDAAWAARFRGREEDHEFTNRLRRSELVAAARAAGLELLADEVVLSAPFDEAERATLAPRFRGASREDLEALTVRLVLRRP